MARTKADPDEGLQLYARFLEGDERAFEELVGLYREGLTQYIYRFVNDICEAEGLMIAAFAELAAGTRFKGGSSLKTYLFSIGRHLALRYVKKRGRGFHIPIDEIIHQISIENPSPENDYLLKERGTQLHTAIRRLKPEYRQVIQLVYFEDMSYEEACEIMGKTKRQISNLLYRAKASLKMILMKNDLSEE